MPNRSVPTTACLALALLLCRQPCPAQAPDLQQADQEPAAGANLAEIASEFTMFTRGEMPRQLNRHPAPLLSYTNPVRARGQVGAIYLWSLEDRPAVIGSLWKFRGDNGFDRLSIELHSLSHARVEATFPTISNLRRPLPPWNPPTAAVKWTLLQDAGLRPAAKPLVRAKTRRNAERFSIEVVDPNTGTAQPLRLLSKPIYEYESKNENVIFGAIFAYVLATDPEAVLLLEARNTVDGIELHYALARITGRPLIAKVGGTEVWRVDRAEVWDGAHAYYFCPNAAAF